MGILLSTSSTLTAPGAFLSNLVQLSILFLSREQALGTLPVPRPLARVRVRAGGSTGVTWGQPVTLVSDLLGLTRSSGEVWHLTLGCYFWNPGSEF